MKKITNVARAIEKASKKTLVNAIRKEEKIKIAQKYKRLSRISEHILRII